MKILYIIHDYWPNHMAGSENYTHYIAHEMARLGHEVFIFTSEKDYKNDYSVKRYVENVKGGQCTERDCFVPRNDNECGNGIKPPLSPLLKKEGRQQVVGVNVIKVHKQNLDMRSLDDSYEDERIYNVFVDIFDEIKPDIVHVQHLWKLSVNIVDYVKSKDIPVIYTIHDLWLECFNINKLTTDENKLCSGASIEKCSECYKMARFRKKQNIIDKMYLKLSRLSGYDKKIKKTVIQKRNDKIKKLIENVDLFISPSKYLKDEFVSFGIPEGKIIYSRNGMNVDTPLTHEKDSCLRRNDNVVQYDKTVGNNKNSDDTVVQNNQNVNEKKDFNLCDDDGYDNEQDCFANDKKCDDARNDGDVVKFVFTSHIQKLKGVDVLMEACDILQKRGVDNVKIEMYGRLGKNGKYNDEFLGHVKKLKAIEYKGAFQNTDINKILSDVDYLILPSIWPENAPLVIDEAYLNNVPCIVSNIGGMAERVEAGVNGLHFKVGDAEDLANEMEHVVKNSGLRQEFIQNIPHVKSIGENAAELEKIYKSMI